MKNLENELYLISIVSKNILYELNGTAFENFALKTLKLKYPDLIQTKPDGGEGDWATDGICMEEGIYFQAYGPEYKDKDSISSSSKKKIDSNFKRALEKWTEAGLTIKEWYFVLNDKYSGAYPELIAKINKIKEENNLEKAGLILSLDLEDLVIEIYNISPQKVKLLLNSPVLGVEEKDLIHFDRIQPLHQVCEYITRKDETKGFEFLDNEPALEDLEKIDKNKLNPRIKSLILTSLDKVDLVNEFFEHNSEFISEDIRRIIVKIYGNYAREFSDKNRVFIKLLEELSSNWEGSKIGLNPALIILVSYYFQLCDIFDK